MLVSLRYGLKDCTCIEYVAIKPDKQLSKYVVNLHLQHIQFDICELSMIILPLRIPINGNVTNEVYPRNDLLLSFFLVSLYL